MDREPQSLTSLPASPTEERNSRMVSYMISMGLRIVCLFLCFIVPGWWVIIPVTGVIVLPALAVMFANIAGAPQSTKTIGRTDTRPSLTSGW